MRKSLLFVAVLAVVLVAALTLSSAREASAMSQGSTAYCGACHPDAHPDEWVNAHAQFWKTEPTEYNVCGSCHQSTFCLSCHKTQ